MSTLIATLNPAKLEPYIDPAHARTMAFQPAASLTITRGTLLGMITASGKVTTYASGNSDGSQVPIGPSEYDFVTDSAGVITLGTTGATPGLAIGTQNTVPVYWRGVFLESELTGLDANAISVLKAREIGVGTGKMLVIP